MGKRTAENLTVNYRLTTGQKIDIQMLSHFFWPQPIPKMTLRLNALNENICNRYFKSDIDK